jgi:hypothetical protein
MQQQADAQIKIRRSDRQRIKAARDVAEAVKPALRN